MPALLAIKGSKLEVDIGTVKDYDSKEVNKWLRDVSVMYFVKKTNTLWHDFSKLVEHIGKQRETKGMKNEKAPSKGKAPSKENTPVKDKVLFKDKPNLAPTRVSARKRKVPLKYQDDHAQQSDPEVPKKTEPVGKPALNVQNGRSAIHNVKNGDAPKTLQQPIRSSMRMRNKRTADQGESPTPAKRKTPRSQTGFKTKARETEESHDSPDMSASVSGKKSDGDESGSGVMGAEDNKDEDVEKSSASSEPHVDTVQNPTDTEAVLVDTEAALVDTVQNQAGTEAEHVDTSKLVNQTSAGSTRRRVRNDKDQNEVSTSGDQSNTNVNKTPSDMKSSPGQQQKSMAGKQGNKGQVDLDVLKNEKLYVLVQKDDSLQGAAQGSATARPLILAPGQQVLVDHPLLTGQQNTDTKQQHGSGDHRDGNGGTGSLQSSLSPESVQATATSDPLENQEAHTPTKTDEATDNKVLVFIKGPLGKISAVFSGKDNGVQENVAESPTTNKKKKKRQNKKGRGDVPCPHCRQWFFTEQDLEFHVKCHVLKDGVAVKDTYQCALCSRRFEKASWLRIVSHVTAVHRDAAELKTITYLRDSVGNYSCQQCGKVYRTDQRLKAHKRAVHIKYNHTCTVCGTVLKQVTYSQARFHTQKCSGKKFICDMCPYITQYRNSIREHMAKVHQKSGIRCEICNTMWSGKFAYKNHMKKHDTNRSRDFTCEHCGNQFYNKASLAMHINRFHDEKADILKCVHCKFTTRVEQDLKTHVIRVHQKRFKCAYCPYDSNSSKNFEVHMSYHDPKKTFACPYETCHFRAETKAMVTSHISAVHMGKHACPSCGKLFPKKAALMRHFVKHTDLKGFQCAECGKEFRNHTQYYYHRKKTGHDANTKKRLSVPDFILEFTTEQEEEEMQEQVEESIMVVEQVEDETQQPIEVYPSQVETVLAPGLTEIGAVESIDPSQIIEHEIIQETAVIDQGDGKYVIVEVTDDLCQDTVP